MELTHLDENGKARMVDISQKDMTERVAVASAMVRMKAETLELIQKREIKKGDVFAAARIAGIMAAKRTPELIPLCHPIPITSVTVEVNAEAPDSVK
ncbi:MAG: cyclic pyranopterin monophosphate synthase MoaC, partial [Anaerolineaceae bacterium]